MGRLVSQLESTGPLGLRVVVLFVVVVVVFSVVVVVVVGRVVTLGRPMNMGSRVDTSGS